MHVNFTNADPVGERFLVSVSRGDAVTAKPLALLDRRQAGTFARSCTDAGHTVADRTASRLLNK